MVHRVVAWTGCSLPPDQRAYWRSSALRTAVLVTPPPPLAFPPGIGRACHPPRRRGTGGVQGPHRGHLKTTPLSPGEPVQFSGQSVVCTREGSVDRSQLVATSGGAPQPLEAAGLAMRRLSRTKPVSLNRDQRCTRPLGVVGLAMRRHSLEVCSTLRRHSLAEPVQFSGQSVSCTRVGPVDRTQLAVTSTGAPFFWESPDSPCSDSPSPSRSLFCTAAG